MCMFVLLRMSPVPPSQPAITYASSAGVGIVRVVAFKSRDQVDQTAAAPSDTSLALLARLARSAAVFAPPALDAEAKPGRQYFHAGSPRSAGMPLARGAGARATPGTPVTSSGSVPTAMPMDASAEPVEKAPGARSLRCAAMKASTRCHCVGHGSRVAYAPSRLDPAMLRRASASRSRHSARGLPSSLAITSSSSETLWRNAKRSSSSLVHSPASSRLPSLVFG